MEDRIVFDVGGKKFTTSISTIKPSNFLSTLCKWEKERGRKEIWIDKDPKCFSHVLGLLRKPSYFFPFEYLDELDFYEIGEPENIDYSKKDILEVKEKMDKIMDKLSILENKKRKCKTCDNPVLEDAEIGFSGYFSHCREHSILCLQKGCNNKRGFCIDSHNLKLLK